MTVKRTGGVEDLDVFRLAHQLALRVYEVSKIFPKEEIYGLTGQIRRAALSVPSNLIEGSNRNAKAEYRHFVGIAKGSAGEAKYQLLLAKDLGYLKTELFSGLNEDYGRVLQMLHKLTKSLSSATDHGHGPR